MRIKKLIKDMCAGIIIFTQIFLMNIPSYAAEEESINLDPLEYIDEIIQVEPDYSSWQDCTVEFSKELYGATSEEKVYIFNVLVEEDESDGYIIVNSDNKLLEYSKNANPYEMALGASLSDVDCGYLNGIYEIRQGDDEYTIDVTGEK